MFCENCGFKNDKDSKFCENCGYRFTLTKHSKEKTEDILFVPKKDSGTWKYVGLIVLVIIIAIIFVGFYSQSKNTNSSSTDNIQGHSLSPTPNEELQTFNSTRHKFMIDLPKDSTTLDLPHHGDDLGFQVIASNGDIYVIGASDVNLYPDSIDKRALLQSLFNNIRNSKGTNFLSSYFTTVGSYPSFEYLASYVYKGSSYSEKAVFILRDDLYKVKVYSLSLGTTHQDLEIKYQRLLNSFKTIN